MGGRNYSKVHKQMPSALKSRSIIVINSFMQLLIYIVALIIMLHSSIEYGEFSLRKAIGVMCPDRNFDEWSDDPIDLCLQRWTRKK